MHMSNETYDFLKKLLTIYIPAFITLFITLTNIWKWDIPVDAIVGTITAITAFAGVILGISTAIYHKENL